MALLSVHNASAAPWGKPLLSDINFTLSTGSILSILGPNGAGKSTLLHCLAGGIALSEGQVLLQDRPVLEWPRLARARAVAMLSQQSTLNFPFPVEEVIQLGRNPHQSGQAEDQRVVEEVMQLTDTLSLRQRLYTQLSGGERQRVQLARVLAQLWRAQDSEVRLLLLDEPTTGLDLEHQQLLINSVRQLSVQGCAVVMVAHDFNLAARLSQYILVLEAGHQSYYGRPEEVFSESMFRDVFKVEVALGKHPVQGSPMVIQL